MDCSVKIWGRTPPPKGGVTESVAGARDALTARGHYACVVDYTRRLSLFRGLRDVGGVRPLVINVASLSSLKGAAAVALVHRRAALKVCYLHGTALGTHIGASQGVSRRAWSVLLGRFDRIWVTNAVMADALSQMLEAKVVSPISAAESGCVSNTRSVISGDCVRLMVAVYEGEDIYGIDLALDTTSRLGGAGVTTELVVAMYGRETPAHEALRRRLRDRKGVTVREHLSSRAFRLELNDVSVFLRPTSTDGDSLAVRQALAAGCRVVATDVVPRPAGVELAADTGIDIADAVERPGRRVSDGAGLGVPIDQMIADMLNTVER